MNKAVILVEDRIHQDCQSGLASVQLNQKSREFEQNSGNYN